MRSSLNRTWSVDKMHVVVHNLQVNEPQWFIFDLSANKRLLLHLHIVVIHLIISVMHEKNSKGKSCGTRGVERDVNVMLNVYRYW